MIPVFSLVLDEVKQYNKIYLLILKGCSRLYRYKVSRAVQRSTKGTRVVHAHLCGVDICVGVSGF